MAEQPAMLATQQVTRPDPDPTTLTTASLLREITTLKELFEAKIDAVTKEIANVHKHVEAMPTQRAFDIGALERLVGSRIETLEEKFASVQTQFKERDIRVEQTARDTKVAVDAALQAAEKAVGKQNEASSLSIAKSEAATNKNIDQLGELIKQTSASTSDKIDDLKERVLRIEGNDLGDKQAVLTHRAQTTSSTQVIGVIAAVVLGLLSLAISLVHLAPK